MTTILYITRLKLIDIKKNFKQANRTEHGKRANEFIKSLEYEVQNCLKPSGNACFLKCNKYIFKNDFSREFFEIIQSCKRRKKCDGSI